MKTEREQKSSSGLIPSEFKKSPGTGEQEEGIFWPVLKQI